MNLLKPSTVRRRLNDLHIQILQQEGKYKHKIADLKRQIAKIQNEQCRHPNRTTNYGYGHSPFVTCNDCGKELV